MLLLVWPSMIFCHLGQGNPASLIEHGVIHDMPWLREEAAVSLVNLKDICWRNFTNVFHILFGGNKYDLQVSLDEHSDVLYFLGAPSRHPSSINVSFFFSSVTLLVLEASQPLVRSAMDEDFLQEDSLTISWSSDEYDKELPRWREELLLEKVRRRSSVRFE